MVTSSRAHVLIDPEALSDNMSRAGLNPMTLALESGVQQSLIRRAAKSPPIRLHPDTVLALETDLGRMLRREGQEMASMRLTTTPKPARDAGPSERCCATTKDGSPCKCHVYVDGLCRQHAPKQRCKGQTLVGNPCQQLATATGYCRHHQPQADEEETAPEPEPAAETAPDTRLAGIEASVETLASMPARPGPAPGDHGP